MTLAQKVFSFMSIVNYQLPRYIPKSRCWGVTYIGVKRLPDQTLLVVSLGFVTQHRHETPGDLWVENRIKH